MSDNDDNERGVGFVPNGKARTPTIWDIYLGKTVNCLAGGIIVYGVLRDINVHKGYADFLPSITGNFMGIGFGWITSFQQECRFHLGQ